MNIAIVLSGGVGKRFGADLPKQYLNLCGTPVINYAMESVLNSKNIDKVVLVIDREYLKYVKRIKDKKVDVVENGKERIHSVMNALNYIKNNYQTCKKIVITQAVSPFVTTNIIDKYLELLDKYDVVTTAQKCTGELFNIENYEKIDRNKYYFCQSPEAFKFYDLLKNINTECKYSELIYHYNNKPKIYYYLDFKNNVKITTKEDLEYCTFLIKKIKKNK